MKADTKPVAAPPQCYVHCYNWVPSVKITHSSHNRCQGAPSFWFSMTFPWPKNENPWPIGTTFPSKRYTTYECIPELVVTVPYARSTIVKKIKQFIIWLYKWSRVTFTELLSAVVKIQRHYHYFPWPLLFSMTFQAWKMVFLNSMTFHDQGAPCTVISTLHSQTAHGENSKFTMAVTVIQYKCRSCSMFTKSLTLNFFMYDHLAEKKLELLAYQAEK